MTKPEINDKEEYIKKLTVKALEEIYAFDFGMIGIEDVKYNNPEDLIKMKLDNMERERRMREKLISPLTKDFYKRIFQQAEKQESNN